MKKKFLALVAAIISLQTLMSMFAVPMTVNAEDLLYTQPDSPSEVYNMNIDWKYKKPDTRWPLQSAVDSADENGKKFYEIDYDDTDWETVSVPHQVNASDSFTTLGSNQGDTGQYRGIVLYRKHFTVPSDAAGKKLFIEFEGMDNACYVWVNGEKVGYYEAGVNAFGFDITNYVTAGEEAVIALANDSTCGRGLKEYYRETIPGTQWGSNNGAGYQWNSHEFRPTQAGLVYNVNLYVKSQIYQTLPIYDNLKTTGTYIWADDFDIRSKSATINVKAEVRNETDADEDITLQVDVVKKEEDDNGEEQEYLKYSFSSTGLVTSATDAGATFETVVKAEVYDDDHEHENTTEVETVDVSYIEASFDATNVDFWSTDSPYLYNVYTILKNSKGEVIDVTKTTTGFRKVEYTIDDGLRINDKNVWLTGYAQRSSNEWAAIGAANDWLTDYDMSLVKESGANFIRWMHIAPRVNSVRSTDKYGVVVVAPAGDKEADVTGRQWSQRVETMRATMIRFRNSPSVIFWESGNNAITAQHQQEMTNLKAKIDPNGGRFSGCRTISSQDQVSATEYVGTMLNRHAGTAYSSMKALNKFVPIVETEYYRQESARRVWDDFSPPDYDLDNNYKSDAATAGYDFYDFTSEDFVLAGASEYEQYFRDRVNGQSGNNYYAAAAALCWTDSNQHARTTYSENGRMSGRVDAIRIPKESFYAYQVMQQENSDGENQIHIVGHWNYEPVDDLSQEEGGNYYYPIKKQVNGVWTKTGEWGRRDPENKTVYVVGSQFVSKIELLVDGEVVGTATKPTNTFIYSFPNVDVTKGDKVEAIAYDARDNVIGTDEIARTGEAVTVRLTPHTGAEGLLADGSDLMYFDVEIVDENGNVCPLSYDKVTFKLTGDATFMGGYNSGYATNKKEGWGAGETVIGKNYVYAECGVNRVFVKAGRNAGTISLTAEVEGGKIAPVTVSFNSVAYPETIEGGLTTHTQQSLRYGKIVETAVDGVTPLKTLGKMISMSKDEWKVSSMLYTAEKNVAQKDVYTVTINGNTVTTVNESYKPDQNTGVVTDLDPVLSALKALGADFEYAYKEGGSKVSMMITSKKGQNGIDGEMHYFEVTQGQTAIGYDGDAEGILTNAEITLVNDKLQLEIAALLAYIDGVSTSTDTENKIFEITYNAQ